MRYTPPWILVLQPARLPRHCVKARDLAGIWAIISCTVSCKDLFRGDNSFAFEARILIEFYGRLQQCYVTDFGVEDYKSPMAYSINNHETALSDVKTRTFQSCLSCLLMS